MAIIGLKGKQKSHASVLILLIVTVLVGAIGLSSVGRPLIKGGYNKVAQPLLAKVRGLFGTSQKAAIETIQSEPSTVGAPALAESSVFDDAMNATREAQRVASIVLNDTTYQVMGYVSDPGRKVVLAVRNDQASDVWTGWQAYKYDGTNGFPDLGSAAQDIHNWVSVGFDPQGYLHVTWDMHNDPLKYRRSQVPVNAWSGGLTQDLEMLGTNEGSVSYVRFHLLDATLYVTFRDGRAGNGDWYLYEYNPASQAWTAGPGLGATDGMLLDGSSDDQNPYLWRDPEVDEVGRMHFAWTWRGSPDVSSGHRVEYCVWNGAEYVTTDGTVLSVPIREGEADVADPVGQNSGLEGVGAFAVDAEGHPHMAYRKDGPDGRMQMFHVWHDGSSWQLTQLTDTNYPSYYALTSDDGMYLSGASIAPFPDGTVALLFTDDADNNHLAKWTSSAPFTSWSKEIIYDGMDLGYYEVSIDRRMLYAQSKLHIPIIPWDNSDPSSGWPAFVLGATDDTSLPVELTMFDAAVKDGVVHLTWETASEVDNAGFEVQRRTGEVGSFENIGFVEGSGTTTNSRTYQFVDDADLPETDKPITYRLKQIDRDGTFQYSSQVEVRLTDADRARLIGNTPNPASGQTAIRFTLARDGHVQLTLYNIEGRRVQTLVDGHRDAGFYKVSFDVGSLASGMYLMWLQAEGYSITRKMTVVR